MSKYINLTQKLVWLDLNRKLIDSLSIFGVLSIVQLFLYFIFDSLYTFSIILDTFKISYIYIYIRYFFIYYSFKIINIFKYINMIQIYSDTQNISIQIGFGSGYLDTKGLNPFEYLTNFSYGSVLLIRIRSRSPISPSYEIILKNKSRIFKARVKTQLSF